MDNFQQSEGQPDSVLIDIDGLGITFGLLSAEKGASPHSVCSYRTADFPTATDCIQNFSNDAGIHLAGRNCAVVVSGAINGDTIKIARCPWIISMKGFEYLFQKRLHFLNDSAAKLWASTVVRLTTHHAHGGGGLPDFSAAGRWIGINYETGLGAAILARADDGALQHIETEAGHTAFSAFDDAERILLENLARIKSPVSWERALFADQNEKAWSGTAIFGNAETLAARRAEMLGSFVGDAILASGSWTGVLMFGTAAEIQRDRNLSERFAKRLESRANFQFALRNVPRWSVAMPDINLVGAAAFLQARTRDGKSLEA